MASTLACSTICGVITVLHTAVADSAGAHSSQAGADLRKLLNKNQFCQNKWCGVNPEFAQTAQFLF